MRQDRTPRTFYADLKATVICALVTGFERSTVLVITAITAALVLPFLVVGMASGVIFLR